MLKIYSKEMGQMIFLEGEFMHFFSLCIFLDLLNICFRAESTPPPPKKNNINK